MSEVGCEGKASKSAQMEIALGRVRKVVNEMDDILDLIAGSERAKSSPEVTGEPKAPLSVVDILNSFPGIFASLTEQMVDQQKRLREMLF